MESKLHIDSESSAQELTAFLKKTFRQQEKSYAVIAVSGGVDSATSASLAVRALGVNYVYPALLPYGDLNKQGEDDARMVIARLKIPGKNVTQVDVKQIVDLIVTLDSSVDNIRRGNIMARVRMIVLYDLAKKRNALVVGTENKSEHLLGYYTRFGDEASDIEPLRDLYKTEVYELAKYLGVPESIVTKKPTAGLWDGQTDEGEFGFTYRDADEILYRLFDEKKSKEEIIKEGFDAGIAEKVSAFVVKNGFKHRLPILP